MSFALSTVWATASGLVAVVVSKEGLDTEGLVRADKLVRAFPNMDRPAEKRLRIAWLGCRSSA